MTPDDRDVPALSKARRSLKTLRKHKSRESAHLHWYHCPLCKGFHLGR